MANEHPFQTLFESLGHLPRAHAEAVNRQAYEILYDILTVPPEQAGRCILLRAPRAGHGKTHLLSRIQHHLATTHEFVPLRAAFGSQINGGTVIDDALRCLLRPLPASGGLCVLDLVTRRLFALALQPLVENGEVPCQDREAALAALRTRPVEMFDFHHPSAVTAHWARDNFSALGQRFSIELAQRSGLPILEVTFWIDALFRFASTPTENTTRLRVLTDEVRGGSPGETVLLERLEALLGMLSLLMRVVLVADNLEGFSADESAALRLAAFLGDLRQSVERLDVILSINEDIWQSAFVPRLSGGLADRLSEVVIELSPLTEDEMLALLESRVPGLGPRMLASVDRAAAGTHARGLIRAAGVAWLRASAMDSPPVASAAAPVPPIPSPLPLPLGGDGNHATDGTDGTVPVQAPVSLGVSAPEPVEPEAAHEPAPVEIPAPQPVADGSYGIDETDWNGGMAPAAETPVSLEIPASQPLEPEAVWEPEPSHEPAPVEPPAPQPLPVAPDVPRVSPFTIVVEDESPVSPVLKEDRTEEVEIVEEAQAPEPEEIPAPQGTLTAPEVTLVSSFPIRGESLETAPQEATNTVPPETSQPAAESPPPAPPPPASPDAERVDVLLKQFLERYGRDSK